MAATTGTPKECGNQANTVLSREFNQCTVNYRHMQGHLKTVDLHFEEFIILISVWGCTGSG